MSLLVRPQHSKVTWQILATPATTYCSNFKTGLQHNCCVFDYVGNITDLDILIQALNRAVCSIEVILSYCNVRISSQSLEAISILPACAYTLTSFQVHSKEKIPLKLKLMFLTQGMVYENPWDSCRGDYRKW